MMFNILQLQSFVKRELEYSLLYSHNPDVQSNRREGVDSVIDYIQQDVSKNPKMPASQSYGSTSVMVKLA